MRSSGRTTVSRTSARTDSLLRRRRGLRTRLACAVVTAASLRLFVLISVSVEECFGATGPAEAPPQRAMRAIGAEIAATNGTPFESGHLLVVAAYDAFALEFHRRNFFDRVVLI